MSNKPLLERLLQKTIRFFRTVASALTTSPRRVEASGPLVADGGADLFLIPSHPAGSVKARSSGIGRRTLPSGERHTCTVYPVAIRSRSR